MLTLIQPQSEPRRGRAVAGPDFPPIDFTRLYLGVDGSKPTEVRAVCLDASAIRSPWPLECLSFKRPDKFLAYVKGRVLDSGTLYVASTAVPNKLSRPVLHYLGEENIPVVRLGQTETFWFEEEWVRYGVKPGYYGAFSLALTLAYRTESSTVVDYAWHMANEAESRFRETTRILDRLSRATRVPF
jgi:hypothetical protein